MKWDLAKDPLGAEQAFFKAAQAAPQGGGAPASDGAMGQARTVVTGSAEGPVVTTTFSIGEVNRRQPPMPQSIPPGSVRTVPFPLRFTVTV